MGFQDSVNRGLNKMGRAADRAKTDMAMSDLAKDREHLMSQLGAALYDATKDDTRFVTGREQLYAGIADIDRRNAEFQKHLDDLAAQEAAEALAYATYTCPRCGMTVHADDSFCCGCGLPMADVMAGAGAVSAAVPSGASVCPRCGAPVLPGSSFCMRCGAPVADVAAPATAAPAAPVSAAAAASAPAAATASVPVASAAAAADVSSSAAPASDAEAGQPDASADGA